MFQWEEEDILLATTPSISPAKEIPVRVGTGTSIETTATYNHSATRLEGQEGLLADTGAVENLTGNDFVSRQGKLTKQHGREVKWYKLAKTKKVSGVGDKAKSCQYKASVPGMLEDGTEIKYLASVIGGEPSPVPPLYGLDSMAAQNT